MLQHYIVAVLALGAGTALHAHDPGLSSLRIERSAAELRVTLTWSGADFIGSLDRACDRNGDGRLAADEFDVDGVRRLARAWLALEVGGALVAWTHIDAALEVNGDVVTTFIGAPRAGAMELTVPALARLPRGHRQFATLVDDGRGAGEVLLSAPTPSVRWNATASAQPGTCSASVSFAGYLALGVEHVLTGYDHLLFLLGLLLAVTAWRQALAVVTAFTVSHSLTLALAVLDIARLPSALVECAIAGSVAVVAADNLLRRNVRARARWSFAFGLVHGFGFASCLADLGVARGLAAARPLVGFNLGVELGQLAVVGLVLPMLLALRHRAPARAARVSTVLSSVVLVCGVVWLMQRWP